MVRNHFSLRHLGVASLFAAGAAAKVAWQQREYNAPVPTAPEVDFNAGNYTEKADALRALGAALGNGSISFPGEFSYGVSNARVWASQRMEHPDAIIFPSTPEEVSIAMQFYSSFGHLWNDGFAILGGGHGQTGGAQSPSIIIDLGNISTTEIAWKPTHNLTANSSEYAILKLGGGAEGGAVYRMLQGTGWAFLGPRANSIGVGGYIIGGGIAFQSGRYGTASDNLLGAEVVLLNGTIVYASPRNEYSDLFWAIGGGGWLGYGVVTHFYIQAYPDPGDITVCTITFDEDKAVEVLEKVANFWQNNTDPDAYPGLVYYYKDPSLPTTLVPIKERRFTLQLNTMYFGDPTGSKYNQSFGTFLKNADSITFSKHSLMTLHQYLLTNYPYGYHREFYGRGHTNTSAEFYKTTFGIFKETIRGMLSRGEDPGPTFWLDEYVFPNWNGAGPESDTETAWPHMTSSHLTLTSGEWSFDSTTEYMYSQDREFADYLGDYQSEARSPVIYDYPNYIAPHSVTENVWGAENFRRLAAIKEKYDPDCLWSRGRVPATKACVKKGLANTFLA